jgi:hypothetical protein
MVCWREEGMEWPMRWKKPVWMQAVRLGEGFSAEKEVRRGKGRKWRTYSELTTSLAAGAEGSER